MERQEGPAPSCPPPHCNPIKHHEDMKRKAYKQPESTAIHLSSCLIATSFGAGENSVSDNVDEVDKTSGLNWDEYMNWKNNKKGLY